MMQIGTVLINSQLDKLLDEFDHFHQELELKLEKPETQTFLDFVQKKHAQVKRYQHMLNDVDNPLAQIDSDILNLSSKELKLDLHFVKRKWKKMRVSELKMFRKMNGKINGFATVAA